MAIIFREKYYFRAVQRSALCRSRRELSNAYLLAEFGLDTAENEPCQVGPIERQGAPRLRGPLHAEPPRLRPGDRGGPRGGRGGRARPRVPAERNGRRRRGAQGRLHRQVERFDIEPFSDLSAK